MLWNMLFGLCILGLVKFGDYISDDCPQAGYACPKICDVDHKHYPRKGCKNANTLQEKEKRYQSVQEGYKGTQAENWQEVVLIRGHKNAKTKQKSKPDSTVVQSIE